MLIDLAEYLSNGTAASVTGAGAPSLRDHLSGVFSWEAFSAFAGLTVSHTARREGSLSLLLLALDLSMDRMAPSTDTFEHDALRAAGAVLLRTARSGDIVGRHGPASFAVVAQDAQHAGVLRLAERIQSALGEHLKLVDPALRFGASIGVASLPQAGRTLPELLELAEDALHRSIAAGRNQVVVARMRAGVTGSAAVSPVAPPVSSQPDQLTLQRRGGFRYLTQAVRRGEIEGVSVRPLPSACPVCLDAARDVYRPGWAPELPLAGCTGPVGCRCVFGSPALDPARRRPASGSAGYSLNDVPRKFRDAARVGGDATRGCKPEDLAEFLEAYPLLPIDGDFGLPVAEPAFLNRPARRIWDGAASTGAAAGPIFPVTTPMLPWVKRVGKLPAMPSDAPQYADGGTLYLTGERLLFGNPGALESFLLTDVISVECFRDAIACTISDFGNRMIFLVRDPLQVGLYLTRAVRDALFPAA